MMLSSLSILIPAFNDEKTIGKVIAEADAVGQKVSRRFEIIVVNDGSTDGTQGLLDSLKSLRVVGHVRNVGYGKTIKELYYKGMYEWLFTIPGDYQVGAKELLKLLPYTDRADMIIGWRKDRNDPVSRLIQSATYKGLLWILFGMRLHDVNSVRLMRRRILRAAEVAYENLDLSSVSLAEGSHPSNKVSSPQHFVPMLRSHSAFVDAELAIKAKKAGLRILEVPINHRASIKKGRSGGGKWWTILPTIWEMINYKFSGKI